ncbi:hypothetical protein PIB30_053862 [Stylosanthes scabra]|uniref:Uncharacterized protein n=1 Tax=Stylosanthes scabra TaxID=79078 RepID=A0ABU6QI41_9FABA|nr:hypothetical protein [Stylosanthes scabra]
MPKKAIVAFSRGKGIRLAIPGPITQSQSGYKSGSSTLQSSKKPTKLSTKKNEVRSSQSTQQAKQTKADYAFPIQTLMALQDQGVTKINKKSWAEICSKSVFLNLFIVMGILMAIQIWKTDHPKAFPILQRHAYVKWRSQFDSSMAYPEKVREWFKSNPKSEKISDPEIALFLNQKAQIQAALAGSQLKHSIKGKLQQILHLLQEDEETSPNEESDQESEDNPNKGDYFGINLDDD